MEQDVPFRAVSIGELVCLGDWGSTEIGYEERWLTEKEEIRFVTYKGDGLGLRGALGRACRELWESVMMTTMMPGGICCEKRCRWY